MTPEVIEVLKLIRRGSVTGLLSKSYFARLPKKMRVAKNLMWGGFVESGGPLGDCLQLTPAGDYVLKVATPTPGTAGEGGGS